MLDAKDVPVDPPAQVQVIFMANCSTEDDFRQFRAPESQELVSPTLIKIGTAASIQKQGKLATQVRLVEEHMLQYIHSYLARFGLIRWCPDLRQSAYSLYNAACRIVAVDTFKQALMIHAYSFLSPNRAYVNDLSLLFKIYDHIVHHYHFVRYQRNVRNPGCVKATDDASPTYQGRRRVSAVLSVIFKNVHALI